MRKFLNLIENYDSLQLVVPATLQCTFQRIRNSKLDQKITIKSTLKGD